MALLENLDGLWAQEVLNERGERLTADSLRDLTLMATEDRKKADKAWKKRAFEEVKTQCG
jgi:hypothetical protein